MLIVLSLAAQGLGRSPLELDFAEYGGEDSPTAKELKAYREAFHEGHEMILNFFPSGPSEFSEAQLCRIRDFALFHFLNNPAIFDFESPFEVRQASLEDGKLSMRPTLSLTCDDETVELDGRERDIRLQEAFRSLSATGPVAGTLVSSARANNPAMLSIVFHFERLAEVPGPFGQFPFEAIDATVALAEKNFRGTGLDFNVLGNAGMQSEFARGVQQEQLVTLMAILFVCLCFGLFLRSLKAPLLAVLVLVLTGALTLGGRGWFGYPMDLLSQSLLQLLVVATTEDLYFLFHAMRRHRLTLAEAARRVRWPCLLTSVTTVLGFGSLAWSEVEVVGLFGLWAAIGALVQWSVLFLWAPKALGGMRLGPMEDTVHGSEPLSPIDDRPHLGRELWLGGIGVLALVGSLSFFALRGQEAFETNDSLSRIFPANHKMNEGLERFGSSREWVVRVAAEAVVTTPQDYLRSDDQGRREEIRSLREAFLSDPLVARVDDRVMVENWLTEGGPSAPFEPILADLILREAWPELKRRFVADDGTERLGLYLKSSDTKAIEAFFERARGSICDNGQKCRIVGDIINYNAFAQASIDSLLESFWMSFGLVFGFLVGLSLWYREKNGLILSVGALWGGLMGFLALALLGVPVNFVTCVFACVLVGLCGDNAIHFLHENARNRGQDGCMKAPDILLAMEEKRPAATTTLLTMIGASLVMLLSPFLPPRELGALLALGLLLSFWGDLFFTRALLTCWRHASSHFLR